MTTDHKDHDGCDDSGDDSTEIYPLVFWYSK